MRNNASDSFIASLSSITPDIGKSLRILKNGIFIAEDKFSSVTYSYETWLKDNNLSVKDEKTISQRVLGDDKRLLYYLPEGQNCLVGYVALYSFSDTGSSNDLSNDDFQKHNIARSSLQNIPESKSSSISAFEYIHPRDPWFTSTTDIRVRQSAQFGTLFEISLKDFHIKIKEPILRLIAKCLRESAYFSGKFPEIENSLRDVIPVICKLLKEARSPNFKTPVFIPETFQNALGEGKFRLLVSSNLVFIIDNDSTIVNVIEQKGKNFRKLIEEELFILKAGKERFLDTIDLYSKDKISPLAVKINGKIFTIDRHAIISLVQDAVSSPWFRDNLFKKKMEESKLSFNERFVCYTVKDILKAIAFPLKYADWVSSKYTGSKSSTDFSEKQEAKSFQLTYLPWTFVTGRNNTIKLFTELGARNKRMGDKAGSQNRGPVKDYKKRSFRNTGNIKNKSIEAKANHRGK
ncbi:MAG TPA: hypothetical protein PKA63_10840 [Oligoflexia bacterium]|nr:hypothetical protein [Oligoflexia bacterium]HMP49153.1 hypothetical protein [Oligoflexia bacterium]